MVTRRFHDSDPAVDGLYSDLAEADLQPLWRQEGLLPRTPNRLTPFLWRWKTLRDLAGRSGELVGIDRGGDRRVLALAHPDLGGLPFATHTLWGAVQFLGGGELAPAHRHSPAALRLVLEGTGVWTLVNGDPIAMEPGDLVLTPGQTWHEHHNPGTEPMVWFDGLDLPLVRNLDAVFFEPGPDELSDYSPRPHSSSEQRFSVAGLVPVVDPVPVEPTGPGRFSPLLAYRWSAVDAALSQLIDAGGFGAATVRYSDPTSGRDVMPTLRAEMHRMLAGHQTPATRRVGSGIWLVFRGSGSTVVDGHAFSWSAGDILVTPSWSAVEHEAFEDSDLFLLSDEPVIEAAGLARTANEPTQGVREGGLAQASTAGS
ncbi:cupin domain-containing protein [Pseudonocardia sp. NPDC049635]|uniref:cupin domain-containing protein n=1 Tax=Pseudonocardia sp. NPDC049635 TaxID=3155506 RepID=UPI00340B809D